MWFKDAIAAAIMEVLMPELAEMKGSLIP